MWNIMSTWSRVWRDKEMLREQREEIPSISPVHFYHFLYAIWFLFIFLCGNFPVVQHTGHWFDCRCWPLASVPLQWCLGLDDLLLKGTVQWYMWILHLHEGRGTHKTKIKPGMVLLYRAYRPPPVSLWNPILPLKIWPFFSGSCLQITCQKCMCVSSTTGI